MGSFSEQDLSTPSTPFVFFLCPETSFQASFYGIVILLRPGFRKGVIMNKYTRLTIDDRIMIQAELAKKTPLSQIAIKLGKHRSTISREIRSHLVHEKKGTAVWNYNACRHRTHCDRSHICSPCLSERRFKKCRNCILCNRFCPDFSKQECSILKKPPYVCNGCGKQGDCTLEKSYYRAQTADRKYHDVLSEIRKGLSFSEKEISALDDLISPLILKGQSPHHICITHPDEIMVSESTVYRLIDSGLIKARNIDLPRKVRFRSRRCRVHKKVDRTCRIGRTYDCFLAFMEENPDIPLVEMDTVEGEKGGKVLLTLHFVQAEMMLAFLRDHNDSRSVIDIFDLLYETIGHDLFCKVFRVCLTDNGSEFSNPVALENSSDGRQRTRIFYCDPGRPDQKGSAERNHEFIRRFFPKGSSFDHCTQEDIRIMMDHINSYHRESIGGRSPYEMFSFMYGEEILKLLKCHTVPASEVTLKKSVFRKEVH